MKPTDGAGVPAGAQAATVWAHRQGTDRRLDDCVADEVPVALVFNGISQAVMLATPLDLEDFALGFAITEGLLERPDQLYGVELAPSCDGVVVEMTVAASAEWHIKDQRRQMAGRTGCGLCGTERLDQVRRTPATRSAAAWNVESAALGRGLKALAARQHLQHATGAVHAAAWCDRSGEVQLVREDVGRHNALDKLYGALLRAGHDFDQGYACITSRASFEMVQKTAMVGASMLVAVSAPTALAIRTAEEAGVALAGFARGDDFVAYTHPARFSLPVAATDGELDTSFDNAPGANRRST